MSTLIDLLHSGRAASVRKAAKAIRRRPSPEVVDALHHALDKCINSSKEWETQYHVLMAIGACRDPRSRALIQRLVGDDSLRLEPMARVGLGTAWAGTCGLGAWGSCGANGRNEMFIEGVVLGYALHHLEISYETMRLLIGAVERCGRMWPRLYLVAIASRIKSDQGMAFVKGLVDSKDAQLNDAVQLALAGRRVKLHPL